MSTAVCWFQRTLKQLDREQTDTQTDRPDKSNPRACAPRFVLCIHRVTTQSNPRCAPRIAIALSTGVQVKEDANSDSSQTKTHEDSGLHTSQIQFLLNSTIGIGSTGEDGSSDTHSTTPNRAAADPTIAGTRDTEGMQDIAAAEQVTGLSTAAGE